MDPIKIHALEIENVKRIKAIAITPTEQGLTILGGNNNQGKTSVLDTIAWALGGDRYRPSNPNRDGSVLPPRIKITLSNGLIVERSGKNSDLKVTDPSGTRSGQQLLNSFVEELALNLPKFLAYNNREKADVLLQVIGLRDKVSTLERQEQELYNQRRTIGQIADQKAKYAKELPFYPDTPSAPVSAVELITRQQAILARNGENQRLRAKRDACDRELAEAQIAFDAAKERLRQAEQNAVTARKSAEALTDEATDAIEADLANIERINVKVRTNLEREKAEQEAEEYQKQYDDLSEQLDGLRKQRYDLLTGAQLPLAGLSVEDGELTYLGKKWDAMSGSDQLRVSAAIVRAIKPQCGFVLLDKLEQMDVNTLHEFGTWLNEHGLQAIATRVSTGDECSVIIEDGMAYTLTPKEQPPTWQKGVF